MGGGEGVEGLVEKLAERLRVLDFFQLRHALLVLHARGLPLLDLAAFLFVHLTAQNLVGIFDDGLAQREHVERIIGRLAIEQRQRVEQVK